MAESCVSAQRGRLVCFTAACITSKEEKMTSVRLAAIVSSALGTLLMVPDQASAMGLNFSWSGTTACSGRSPAFTVSSVPKGTSKLRFNMVDLDVPNYPHGGGTVAYTGGGSIPAGAFGYTGPCPPSGRHNYRWTVQALDDSGKTLATATATKPFPP
jgi:phosphatidylethanolamine-binding protein (PEBP) family uncharacterized protein